MSDGTGSGTTDQDYIRQAVELADGFEYKGNETTMAASVRPFVKTPIGLLSVSWDSFIKTPAYLDALAAQLVRQVDAIDGLGFDSKGSKFHEVIVWDFRPGKNRMAASVRGPDRTMNTIKAIVDSGVLAAAKENDDGPVE